jgi:anti-sigma B factor antagonist
MAMHDDPPTERGTRFTAQLHSSESETVVALSGEIDLSVVPALQDSLALAVEGAAPRVSIDLSRVTFLDSTGIGQLVDACKRVRDSGRTFTVSCVPGIPRLVLETVGLIDYLGVRDHAES